MLQVFSIHQYSIFLFEKKKGLNDYFIHSFIIPVCAGDIEAVCSKLVPLFVVVKGLYALFSQEE